VFIQVYLLGYAHAFHRRKMLLRHSGPEQDAASNDDVQVSYAGQLRGEPAFT
jgi:hypothetical protein